QRADVARPPGGGGLDDRLDVPVDGEDGVPALDRHDAPERLTAPLRRPDRRAHRHAQLEQPLRPRVVVRLGHRRSVTGDARRRETVPGTTVYCAVNSCTVRRLWIARPVSHGGTAVRTHISRPDFTGPSGAPGDIMPQRPRRTTERHAWMKRSASVSRRLEQWAV